MGYTNILLDEEYNITGVLDWSGAEAVPIEMFCRLTPDWSYPALPKELVTVLFEAEAKFDEATPISKYMTSDLVQLGGVANWPRMPLEKWRRVNYAEDMIKYLYGETADREDVKKMYFGSIMY
jgi:hypothetical protein